MHAARGVAEAGEVVGAITNSAGLHTTSGRGYGWGVLTQEGYANA